MVADAILQVNPANVEKAPKCRVIAFNTIGGRIVLESYSPQPLVLVLN